MCLTWVNIFQLNNLGWNEAVPLFLLADSFYFSALVSLFMEFQDLNFPFFCVLFVSDSVHLWMNSTLISSSDEHKRMTIAKRFLVNVYPA